MRQHVDAAPGHLIGFPLPDLRRSSWPRRRAAHLVGGPPRAGAARPCGAASGPRPAVDQRAQLRARPPGRRSSALLCGCQQRCADRYSCRSDLITSISDLPRAAHSRFYDWTRRVPRCWQQSQHLQGRRLNPAVCGDMLVGAVRAPHPEQRSEWARDLPLYAATLHSWFMSIHGRIRGRHPRAAGNGAAGVTQCAAHAGARHRIRPLDLDEHSVRVDYCLWRAGHERAGGYIPLDSAGSAVQSSTSDNARCLA